MKDTLVTYPTSKLAKDKGFNWDTFYYHATSNGIYSEDDKLKGYTGSGVPAHNWNKHINNRIEDIEIFSAPTQSMLAKWLRDVHHIQVYAYSSTINMAGRYRDYVVYINNRALNDERDEEYQSYEEAMEFGLFEALKSI